MYKRIRNIGNIRNIGKNHIKITTLNIDKEYLEIIFFVFSLKKEKNEFTRKNVGFVCISSL